MLDNLSLLDCIESMSEEFYDHCDSTDSLQSNIPYTKDASRNKQNTLQCPEILDFKDDFDEAEFGKLLSDSLAQNDTNDASRKRKCSSELPDSKRQRLDMIEDFDEEDFEKLLSDSLAQFDPVKPSKPPNSFLSNGKSVQKNQSHSTEKEKSRDLSSNSELSADKSNSSSFGRGYRSLKIVGKPLREKPLEEKKLKKSSPNSDTSSESLPPPQKEEMPTQKPNKITLSWKVVAPKQELAKNSTNIRQNHSNVMVKEFKPQPMQIKISPTSKMDKPKQPDQVIAHQKLSSLTMAPHLQAHHFDNPKPIQRFYQNLTTQNIKESIKFVNFPKQPVEAKFKNMPLSYMNVAPHKKLRLVSKETANVSQACGEKSQPVAQHRNVEPHLVTFKKRPDGNLPSESRKIFKLVPFRRANV